MKKPLATLGFTAGAVVLTAASALAIPAVERATGIGWPKSLLWNLSPSAPLGLYLMRPAFPLHINELVAVALPVPLGHYAATQGYLPLGVPLLKHVAALPGQRICRQGSKVTISAKPVAIAAVRDHLARPLPAWSGCYTLKQGEVFLLNRDVASSFDGRYFGPLLANRIIARAIPLWTKAALKVPAVELRAADSVPPFQVVLRTPSPERMPSDRQPAFVPTANAALCSAHCTAGRAALLPSAASSRSANIATPSYSGFVREASDRFDIPARWIAAIMHVESNGNERAVSSKGAIGLMQLMPTTWSDIRLRYQLGTNPFDPHDNIIGGTGYLRELYDHFGPSRFLAAYHAGPSRLEAVLAGHRILGPDTLKYVARLSAYEPALPVIDASMTASPPTDWRLAALFPGDKTSHQPSTPVQSGDNALHSGPHPNDMFVAVRTNEQP